MYQIVRYSPVHCPVTDGLVGTRARVLPMTYRSARLAALLAARLESADYEACGDDSFRVVPVGVSAFPVPAWAHSAPALAADDCPF